jgi:hypothetical protein
MDCRPKVAKSKEEIKTPLTNPFAALLSAEEKRRILNPIMVANINEYFPIRNPHTRKKFSEFTAGDNMFATVSQSKYNVIHTVSDDLRYKGLIRNTMPKTMPQNTFTEVAIMERR